MYIAAMLRKNGYSVEIFDADVLNLSIEQTIEEILKKPASIIGFSVIQRALPSLKFLVNNLRKKDIDSHICCGGFAATLSCEIILKELSGVNSIVIGEGEKTFLTLTEKVIANKNWKDIIGIAFREDGKLFLNRPTKKPDLNNLPLPVRDILPICLEKTNYATISASRGCYGACTFCSNYSFEKSSIGCNWRGRNPKNIVDEIEELHKKYGVKVFKFNNPNIFGPGRDGRKHVVDLCKEIIKRKFNHFHFMGFCRSNDLDLEIAHLMKMSGIERMLIGIESSIPETLKYFRKGETIEMICDSIEILKKAKIEIVPGFMIFNPYTSISTIKKDLLFLKKYGFTPTLSKSLRIFDGTSIQSILSSENRLVWRNPFEGYHEYIVDRVVASIYMSIKMLSVEWIDIFKKTYQTEFWQVKKSLAFNQRQNFYSLSELVFSLENQMLQALISWTENDFTFSDIENQLNKMRSILINTEEKLISLTGLTKKKIDLKELLHIKEMTGKISSILKNQLFCTFPEKYRWNDD